jgi:1,4-dihydroxy-2-naphthoate octaprenyltransferase
MMAPQINGWVFALTLLFSLFIQIGTNFANDYFDFVKGADTDARKGPARATQQGWISPSTMLRATWIVFALSILIAIPLMLQAGPWSFVVAALCVAFGIMYTGGPKPLGYLGLGELLVFVFFGPVAVCGSFFLQTGQWTLPVLIASFAPGLLSCAILIANNLRDEETDRIANKKTLVVRFGRLFGAIEYTLAVLIPCAILYSFIGGTTPILFALFTLPNIIKAFRSQQLAELLPKTALLLILYTLIFIVATA